MFEIERTLLFLKYTGIECNSLIHKEWLSGILLQASESDELCENSVYYFCKVILLVFIDYGVTLQ